MVLIAEYSHVAFTNQLLVVAYLLGVVTGLVICMFCWGNRLANEAAEALKRLDRNGVKQLDLVDSAPLTGSVEKCVEKPVRKVDQSIELPIPAGIMRPPRAAALGRKVDQGQDGPQQDAEDVNG